jgi:hypothetical protein
VLLAPSRVVAEPLEPEAGRRVAAALVQALNAGDEDAAVALFDIQATVAADRLAWVPADVRHWIRLQLAERISIQPTSAYDVVGHRVKWMARVFRSDWHARGADPLEVWDSVLVDRNRIVAFMSQPTDARARALLGEAWSPGKRAEPIPEEALTNLGSGALRTLAGALGLLTVAAVLGAVILRRAQVGRTRGRPGRLRMGRLKEFADARRMGRLSVIPAALVLAQLGAPDPADPLVVVESFLAARNARDALGATAFCANTLSVDDSDGQWIGDAPAVTDWLRRLTDTYVIDTLVRPHADGQRMAWTERLVSRRLPFPDALATALEVKVEVVVQDGHIAAYSAAYPGVSPRSTGAPDEPGGGGSIRRAEPVSIGALFALAALGSAGALLLLWLVPAIRRARS